MAQLRYQVLLVWMPRPCVCGAPRVPDVVQYGAAACLTGPAGPFRTGSAQTFDRAGD
jgi:hypothetical protein